MTAPDEKGETPEREAAAWHEVARRIEVRGLISTGLCFELECARFGWFGEEFIAQETWMVMISRLRRALGGRVYLARERVPYPRIQAARQFARDAEMGANSARRAWWLRIFKGDAVYSGVPDEGGEG